jgi:hypothetical protein
MDDAPTHATTGTGTGTGTVAGSDGATPAMMDDDRKGKVDLVAVLYVVGGVPALVTFLVVLFWVSRTCQGFPA